MESANIHRKHPLQDQLVGSSALEYSPSFAAGSAAHPWNPNTILNTGIFSSNANAVFVNSRNPRLQNDNLVSSLNSSITQELSFDGWPNGTANFSDQSSNGLQLSQIKRELSDSYPKFIGMISSPSSGIEDMQTQQPTTCYTKKDHTDIDDMNVKLLLRTLSSGGQSGGLIQSRPEEFYCTSSDSSGAATHNRGTFSHIYPTINVSNFNQSSLANSSACEMNLQALDLFQSSRFCGSFCPSLQDQLDLPKNGLSYGLDCMKQSIQRPSDSSNITSFNNGVAEAKRSDIILERRAPQAASKRSRLAESRASCPPFKVRKEKLGDRIAALQQLVAPFGKTDTASVLMEAIGYIKFLQNQVETLSVPYLKSSRNKTNRAVMKGGPGENGNEERKRDLKSRGLCLVPLSCLSYVADGGGGIWPPPSFGGGT